MLLLLLTSGFNGGGWGASGVNDVQSALKGTRSCFFFREVPENLVDEVWKEPKDQQ